MTDLPCHGLIRACTIVYNISCTWLLEDILSFDDVMPPSYFTKVLITL